MINRALIFSLVMAAFLTGEGTYWWTSWAVHWLLLISVISFWISIYLSTRLHWSVGLAFLWTMLSGIAVFAGRGGIYIGQPIEDLIAYKGITGYSSFALLSITVFLMMFIRYIDAIEDTMAYIVVLGMAMTYYTWWHESLDALGHWNGWANPHLAMGGLFGNPSENLCFLAFAAPVVMVSPKLRKLRDPFIAFLIAAIAFSATRAPAFVLAATVAAIMVAHYRSIKALIGAPIVALLVITSFYLVNPVGHPDTHGRFEIYHTAMSHWWNPVDKTVTFEGGRQQGPMPHIDVWKGAGNGVSQIFLPHLQVQNLETSNFCMWMHSDLLQTVFEQGIIGGLIYLILIICALLRAWDKPWLFSSLVGMIAAAGCNYPARMAMQAFYMAFVCVRIFILPTKAENNPNQTDLITSWKRTIWPWVRTHSSN